MLTPGQGLALLRSGFGLYFVSMAFDKTLRGWLTDGGAQLASQLQNQLPRAEGFSRPTLEGTVLPHAGLFAQLVTLGEGTTGLLLLLGLLTRLGARVGLWLNLQYTRMKGLPVAGGSIDRLFVLADA